MVVDYEKLAISVGYSYLNGGIGYWEDGAGKVHSLDSMNNEYLNRCIKFIDRGIQEISNNENTIKNDIKKELSNIYNITGDDEIERAKQEIIKLLKIKKNELTECAERRKSYKQ